MLLLLLLLRLMVPATARTSTLCVISNPDDTNPPAIAGSGWLCLSSCILIRLPGSCVDRERNISRQTPTQPNIYFFCSQIRSPSLGYGVKRQAA